MSSQFYAINESGYKVPRDSNESLGVIPMVTVSYLSFEDMAWNDIARVSRRVSRNRGCYTHRLGEKKSVELTNGKVVKVGLVGLNLEGKSGFVFQITDGLDRCEFNNFIDESIYELLPDDLKEVIVPTSNGTVWSPTIQNIMGPDIENWYDWYEYHNSPEDRVLTDREGLPSGYWLSYSTELFSDPGKLAVIDDKGNLSYCNPDKKLVPSTCFFIS